MRYTQTEKMEIIRLVESSELSINATLKKLGIQRSTFYHWYDRYQQKGYDGLAFQKPKKTPKWNQIPDSIRQQVVKLALNHEELSPRELAVKMTDEQGYYISESSVYRILKKHGLIQIPAFVVNKAKDKFQQPTCRVNEMWQTDFTYLKVIGWGWYYLSTILDDYSRFIVSWDLCKTMTTDDVENTINAALMSSAVSQYQKPKLLSDNGSCYISGQLQDFLEIVGMNHVRGAPAHPQTQGKIERYHRTLKNVIKLDNYYSPEELRSRIGNFVHYYNFQRYHESLNNLTPSDVYYGREDALLRKRERTKKRTMKNRRINYLMNQITNT